LTCAPWTSPPLLSKLGRGVRLAFHVRFGAPFSACVLCSPEPSCLTPLFYESPSWASPFSFVSRNRHQRRFAIPQVIPGSIPTQAAPVSLSLFGFPSPMAWRPSQLIVLFLVSARGTCGILRILKFLLMLFSLNFTPFPFPSLCLYRRRFLYTSPASPPAHF